MAVPNWIWPQAERAETTGPIRASRLIHWWALAVGSLFALDGARGFIEVWLSGHFDLEELIVPAVMGAVIGCIGRGIRYVLANE